MSFSALQRAENSSNIDPHRKNASATRFQCSSASRKFLKVPVERLRANEGEVSVLFSEPKIPQTKCGCSIALISRGFSALQRAENSSNVGVCIETITRMPFQCSSASRKFLKGVNPQPAVFDCWFQCSSASRKFLKTEREYEDDQEKRVSVLFSEPKIPQRRCWATQFTRIWVSVLFSEPKIPQT